MTKRSAFTLIELLVVVAIIGILTGVAIPAFNAFNRRQTLTQATKNLKTDLRAARNRAVSGVDGKRWGGHLVLNRDNYTTFSTSSFAYSAATSTQTKDLPSGVTISDLSWNHGSPGQANVVFDRITGEVSIRWWGGGQAPVSDIIITLSLSGVTRTVRVDSGGKIYEKE